MTGINLFIGAGGSGSATLRWLYHDLKQRLIANGWPWDERARDGHAMPRCWRFVEIDVDATGNPSGVPDVPAGAFKRIVLASEPDQMSTIYNLLRTRHLRPELNGWLPQLAEMAPFNPYEGAGQYRAIGRSVFLARGAEALEAIRNEAIAATGVDALADLADLGTYCNLETSGTERRAVLVSSLSGGSGSGMWLDIAQWLNGRPGVANQAWMTQQLYTFLYLPEVHELIDGPGGGLMPNGMLSAVEMLSAYADRAPYDDMAQARLTSLGIAPHTYSTKAPRNLFLVGRAGTGGVAYETVGQVYTVTSRTIGALAFSHGAGFSRVTVNEQTPPPQIPLLRVADHVTSSNIGYSRLDLGRQALSEYSVRRIFRSTMLQLMDGHRSQRLNDFESDEDTIRRLANGVEQSFFADCGLHERDGDFGSNDQILEAMLPSETVAEHADRFQARFSAIVDEVYASIRDRKQRDSQLSVEYPPVREKVLSAAQLEIMRNAVAYADDVRVRLLGAVAEAVASYSVPVAVELLRRLDQQLDDAHQQLVDGGANAAGNVATLVEEFFGNMREKLPQGRRATLGSVYLERRRAACSFIREVQSNLIRPAVSVLDGWAQRSRDELRLSDMKATVFDWNGVETPDDLVPPPNVIMLEEPSEFDDRFRALIESTLSVGGEPRPFDDALRAAIVEITSYQWPEVRHNDRDAVDVRAAGQLFLRPTGQFGLSHLRERLDSLESDPMPSAIAAAYEWFTSTDIRGAKASFRVATWSHLLGVTRAWCTSRGGAMSRYLGEGFGAWLDSSHPSHAQRAREFGEEFERAVRSAAPLVQYDNDVFTNVVRADATDERLIVEPDIPVSFSSPLGNDLAQRVARVHRGLQVTSSDFSVGRGDTSQIELMRSFDQGMHPLAFSSLTRAIIDGFGQAGDRFWSFRRARPLAQSLGLSPAQVVAMTRGWVVVRLLNLLDRDNGRIFLNGVWMPIPQERLRGSHHYFRRDGKPSRSGWFSIALESLPYRLMKYPYDTSSLDFYVQLADLGGYADGQPSAREQESVMNGSDGGASSQVVRQLPVVSPALRLWWETGVVPHGAPVPEASVGGTKENTPEERRTLLLKWLEDAQEMVSGFRMDMLRQDGDAEADLLAEEQLVEQFLTSIAQLTRSLDGEHLNAGGSPFDDGL